MVALAGCASLGARLSSKPGAYTVTVQLVHAPHRDIHATYVRPVQDRHPGYLVMFVTGDDGWFGTSRAVFTHLEGSNYASPSFFSTSRGGPSNVVIATFPTYRRSFIPTGVV